MSPEQPDPSLPARLREFHARLPLAGGRPNGLLALPEDRLLYLASLLRDMPVPAPALSLDEWRGFLDLLRPHGVYALLARRLRSWPADCRPPAEIMDYLNRIFLYAAARAMRAGRQIQTAVDALEAADVPSGKAVLPHLRRKRTGLPVSERFVSAVMRVSATVDPGGAPALRVTGCATGG